MDSKRIGGLLAMVMWEFLTDEDEEECATLDERPEAGNALRRVSEVIVGRMEDRQFQFHLRMNRSTFEDFVDKISATTVQVLKRGQVEIPIEKRCLITIWCLVNPECFRSVADRFGISVSTCWRALYLTCEDILKINDKYGIVRWPTSEQAQGTSDYFEGKTHLPGVIGCIGGSHIRIKAPKESPSSYVNGKGYHSLLLQGVCDEKSLFIDCYAGEAGSVPNGRVYERSDLNQAIQEGKIEFGDHYLVGDASYPLKHHLMTPFAETGCLSSRQKHFNHTLSTISRSLQSAFAQLKGRFRRLEFLETIRQDLAVLMIISSCILHNICLLQGDTFDQKMSDEEEEAVAALEVDEPPERGAITKRKHLADALPSIKKE